MPVEYNPLAMATEMMTSALTILDALGERSAATQLQYAISIVKREPRPATVDDVIKALGADTA